MVKYEPLRAHLLECGEPAVPMTFAEVEEIVGAALPPSAFKHRAWWSNNPSNSVITLAWLDAGYKSAQVDMTDRKLVFRKSDRGGSVAESDNAGSAQAPDGFDFSRIYGALEGTVTVKPGTDLTEPVGVDWEAAR